MLKCPRVQPHLLDFSTGRLEAGLARGVADHLTRCAICRGLLRREKQTAALWSGIARPQPRADAWPVIEAALRSAAVSRRRPLSLWQPLLWTGGLAAAGALTVSLLAPSFRAPVAPHEPDLLRALAPRTAAGLVPERSSDPLLVLQRKLDRALDRVADDGS